MPYYRKYGEAAIIDGIPLTTVGAIDYKTTPTLAEGDVKISKDGGALANLTTLPAETPAGSGLVRISLSIAELTCARVAIRFIDQTSPKQWEDQIVDVETVGHASATLAFDLDMAEQTVDAVKISGSSTAADNVEANIGNLDASVSGRATPAQVTTAIETYDGPTDADMVAGHTIILADLTTLLERLTAGRATKIDNLDAAMTTRSTLTAAEANAACDAALTDYAGPTDADMVAAFAVIAAALFDPATDRVILADSADHGGSSTVITLDHLLAIATGANPAVSLSGGPDGAAGIYTVGGGAFGEGIKSKGAGYGMGAKFEGGLLAGSGLYAKGGPDSSGIAADGTGLGAGLEVRGGTTGHGIEARGRGAEGDGINAAPEGDGDKINWTDDISNTTNVILGAVQASSNVGNRIGAPIPLEMFANETKAFPLTVLDADGIAVDLSDMTLRFVVFDGNDPPTGKIQKDEGDGDIVVSGTGNNVATVTVEAADVADATPAPWVWILWDTVSSAALLWGTFEIKPAVDEVA